MERGSGALWKGTLLLSTRYSMERVWCIVEGHFVAVYSLLHGEGLVHCGRALCCCLLATPWRGSGALWKGTLLLSTRYSMEKVWCIVEGHVVPAHSHHCNSLLPLKAAPELELGGTLSVHPPIHPSLHG